MLKLEHFEEIAFFDEVTGLRNLKGFKKDFENESLDDVHFIYVDIDEFNRMSAMFGEDAMDDILASLAKSLVDFCGQSDVYRVGNDQFILLTKSHYICEPSELMKILRNPITHEHLQYNVNVSICVLDHDDFPDIDLDQTIRVLRYSIDRYKHQGKNLLIFADDELYAQYQSKKEVEKILYEAVKNDRFYPKFQPFVDTFNNEIIGFETVSRLRGDSGVLKPDVFLELAEFTGLIYDIEMKMFEEMCKFYRELKDHKDLKVSSRFKAAVNFSKHTLERVKFEDLEVLLNRYDMTTNDVIIEVKEHIIQSERSYETVQSFHELGFLVALDEYTNESSSFLYLADIKVDIVKMSETLLQQLADSLEFKRIHKVYEFMVRVAKEFNLTVVSCGVHSSDLLKIVKHMDVEIGVGKYFSESLEKNDFVKFLMENKKRFKIL